MFKFFKLSAITILSLVSILIAVVVYEIVPFSDVHKLKRGHVAVEYRDGDVVYKIVERRPKSWIPLSLISESGRNAIQISEDWSFYTHYGIDLRQLWDAVYDHIVFDKPLRGASTISQQLVKNLFLNNERSYLRKIKEAVITLYMDATLSKEKILEAYLNIIEYGDGIYGIKKASKFYFKKHPAFLTPRQGAFLAMLLPNPKLYSKSYEVKLMSPFAEQTIQNILHKMKVAKYIDEDTEKKESSNHFKWELPFTGLFRF